MSIYKNVHRCLALISLFACMLAGFYSISTASANDITIVSVSPLSQAVSEGETFTLEVDISTAQPIAGIQFDLSFDSSVIKGVSITEGPLLGQSGCPTYFLAGTIDNSAGTITGVAGTVLGQGCTVSESGTFATITLNAGLIPSVSSLDLFNVKVVDIYGDPIDIHVLSGSVIVGEYLPTPTASPPPTSTPTLSLTPTSTPTHSPTPSAGLSTGAWAGIGLGILLVAGAAIWLIMRRQKKTESL